MKKIIILSTLLLVLACQPENEIYSTYDKVIDGDTFIAQNQRIRLWGIDAPEKYEAESFAAKLYLKTLLDQGQISCEFIELDKYKRSVMRCYSGKDDIAESMVKMGMAKDYTHFSAGYYKNAEKYARKNKFGIWSKPEPDYKKL